MSRHPASEKLMRPILLLPLLCLASSLLADEAPPRSLDPRLTITLFAENLQIVTLTESTSMSREPSGPSKATPTFPPKTTRDIPATDCWSFATPTAMAARNRRRSSSTA